MHNKFAQELNEVKTILPVWTRLRAFWPSRSRVENENKAATNRYWVSVVNLELRGLILLEMCTDWEQIKKHLQQVQILTSHIRNLENWADPKKKKITRLLQWEKVHHVRDRDYDRDRVRECDRDHNNCDRNTMDNRDSLLAWLTVKGLKVWDQAIVLMLCL